MSFMGTVALSPVNNSMIIALGTPNRSAASDGVEPSALMIVSNGFNVPLSKFYRLHPTR